MKNQAFLIKDQKICTDEISIFLHAFFNNANQYQVLLNKNLDIITFNDFAFKLNHKSTAIDLQAGKNILNYVDSSLKEDFKTQCQIALQGKAVRYEHFVDGGWFDFEITALHNFENAVIGLSIVGSNISDQKKNAKIIRQQSEYLSNIAWFQSHQLRHPVASVLALLNLIKEEQDYHLTKEYLQALEIVTKQLDTIINAVVQQSREV